MAIEAATVATLKAIYDRGTDENPIAVRTQDDLEPLVDRVRSYSTGHPFPAVVELTVEDDPWDGARICAGIGDDRGFVQELWNPPRAALGDPGAAGVVVYDLQAHDTEIPASQEFPLATIRTVLTAYLTYEATIPRDFVELHPTDAQENPNIPEASQNSPHWSHRTVDWSHPHDHPNGRLAPHYRVRASATMSVLSQDLNRESSTPDCAP
ncbi:Imm1 family immunity protein [Umezawaea sp. Da 62-37]|uniref:Imm1 family immunity protein n=1 Tax=Umezawaea sp. Da 62-37 TaxID=3075927 RepID=UPI0028F74C02|nr:Imm1 family immunity protein [Umezawaea sp. Da 62-37]WNV84734.1 Imm1 family immunity protein [Umezawaea sp. Da 62-37]